MKIAVRAALCSLKIIGLRGLYATESRSAALNVYNKRRQIRSRKVGKPLALKRYTGA